jgi:hypothetical protein
MVPVITGVMAAPLTARRFYDMRQEPLQNRNFS